MIEYIGKADVPGISLKYYVFGNRKTGYGIQIVQRGREKVRKYVSQNLFEVLNLARQLCRCSVFPDNLCDIMEDLRFKADAN